MESVISELRKVNQPVPVPLELPDMDDIVQVEEQLLMSLGKDFREFLLTVSDVVYGTLEPVTAVDPQSHTYLPEVAAQAWSKGVPRYLVPICEIGDGYYCVNEHSEVVLWKQGKITEDLWSGVWQWAGQVWLSS